MRVKENFKLIKRVFNPFVVSSGGSSGLSSTTIDINSSEIYANALMTLICTTQSMYINVTSNALSTSGLLLNEDDAIDFKLSTSLWMSAPSTLAMAQAIIWE